MSIRVPAVALCVSAVVVVVAFAGLGAAAAASAGGGALRGGWSEAVWRPLGPGADSASVRFVLRQQFLAKLPYDNGLFSVEATSRRDAWAVGGTWVAYKNLPDYAVHWNGRVWRVVHFPDAEFVPTSVRASSAHDVWFFGFSATKTGSEALRWDGAHWHVMTLPPDGFLARRPVVLGRSDVWLAGDSHWSGATGWRTLIWHWDGSSWRSYRLPIAGDLANFTIAGSSDRNLWVAGNRTTSYGGAGSVAVGPLAAYRWTGTAWHRMPLPRVWVKGWAQVAVSASGEVWIAGTRAGRHRVVAVVLRRTGSTWSRLPDRALALAIHGVWGPIPDGLNGVWFPWDLYWSGRSAVGLLLPPDACQGGFYAPSDPSIMTGIPGTHSMLTVGGCQLSPSGKIEGEITLTRVR